MDPKKAIAKLQEMFGSREAFLGHTLIMLSTSGQPCDLTFFKKKPMLDVVSDQQLGLALMHGAGSAKLAEMLSNIKLSNGHTVSLNEIWTINPMPKGGFSKEELEAVDLAQGEEPWGPDGETLRKMISDTYHCENREEEDYYLADGSHREWSSGC